MKGSFKRGFYIIPGFKEIAKLETTFWNIATVAAIGWVFYNKVDIVAKMTKHGIHGSGYLIMYKEPRKSIDPEAFVNFQKLLEVNNSLCSLKTIISRFHSDVISVNKSISLICLDTYLLVLISDFLTLL